MNIDNRRLTEIQRLKNAYKKLMAKNQSINEIEDYHHKLEELETEEKEILNRFDVKI